MIGEAEADHHLPRDRPYGGSAPKLIYRGEGRRMDEDLGNEAAEQDREIQP